MKSICMSCKHFKIEDTLSGLCRVTRKEIGNADTQDKMVRHGDTCSKWIDCGQQYYIRLGWVKAQSAEKSQEGTQ